MDEPSLKPQEEVLPQDVPVETGTKAPDEALLQKDKYVRLLAEFDNMRKRHERERSDLIKYAHEEVIIQCIHGRACAQRLLDLGLVPGERAIIKRKLSNGALVVQVKGCDVAVSPEIASAIGVERSP